MDLIDAASYFDRLPVTDAYSGIALFTCQMDQYDSTERDSMTGWRRTCSAAAVTLPARRAVAIDGSVFLAGNTVKDYFEGQKIREHLLLHPVDGLYQMGYADAFLNAAATDPTSLYGALALRKEQKEESESSQFFNLYNIYVALGESADRDFIARSAAGVYYRIQNYETQTGGFKTLYVSELGAGALQNVTYIPAGVRDVAMDTVAAGTAEVIPGIVERYQSNYRYLVWAAEKYRNGDTVVTVSAAAVALPGNNDRVQVGSSYYRVLERQSDGHGAWELHLRPTPFNLVET